MYLWSVLPKSIMLKSAHNKSLFEINNHKAVQNHIHRIHTVATALLAETVTGFVTSLTIFDESILLIKYLKIDYVKIAKSK